MKTTINEIMNSYRFKRLAKSSDDFTGVQRFRILSVLLKRIWREVPLTSLMVIKWRAIAQYNARIYELRGLWFDIVNRKEWMYDKDYKCMVPCSYYTLNWLR